MARAVAPLLAPDGRRRVAAERPRQRRSASPPSVGAARVLGARVIFGAEVAGAGTRAGHGRTPTPVLIGSPDPADSARATPRRRAGRASSPRPASRPAPPTALVAELWAKVFYNAALNPLGALLGVPYGALPADPDARAIMDEVIDEAFAVARAPGRARSRGRAEAVPRRLLRATGARDGEPPLVDAAGSRARPPHRDRRHQRLRGGRGAAHGIPTPVNATLTRMIRARVRRPRASEERWSTLIARPHRARRDAGARPGDPSRRVLRRGDHAVTRVTGCSASPTSRTASTARRRTSTRATADRPTRRSRRSSSPPSGRPASPARGSKVFYHSHPVTGAYFSGEDRARAMFGDEPAYPEVT